MKILIVEDDAITLELFSHILSAIPDVTLIDMADPLEALAWCVENEPDLLLLDYIMPNMNGLEFLLGFRSLPGKAQIPVIMTTADVDRDIRYTALQKGVSDFLNKPVDRVELLARVSNMLTLRRSQRKLSHRARWLADEVRKATATITAREKEVILRLSRAAEYRDPETGTHLLRMAAYSSLIASNLGLSIDEQNLINDAAPMHDIGKVGIPDHILLKPGPLDADEIALIRMHPKIGEDILSRSNSPLLQTAATIALSHHEKYNGSGYPYGLRGEQIPLYGRIAAVADAFDALTSTRPYKPAVSMHNAAALLTEGSGQVFDPECVEAFLRDWNAVLQVHDSCLSASPFP